MSRRRLIAALLLALAATVFFACAAPHLSAALDPTWTSSTPAEVFITGGGRTINVSAQSRPFVDLYSVGAGRAYATYVSESPPHSAVRTDFDPADFIRVDTALEGWPLRAMASEAWVPHSGPIQFRSNVHLADTPRGPILIPLRPLPLNFLADTLLFTIPAYLLLSIPCLSPSWWAAGRRLRRGRCPTCGYDLHWNLAPGCPECGWRRDSSPGRRA